jgi:circadian clock protein KaiC
MTRGTSTLLLGPAGTGKSAIIYQYAVAAASRGESCLIFAFDENLLTVFQRADAFGLPLRKFVETGKIVIRQIDPAEMSTGEFAHIVRHSVERENIRLVAIDSINGFLHAMSDAKALNLQLHELLTYLGQRGVSTLMTVTQQGLVGPMQSPVDVTYVTDNVILFRFFENAGAVKKAISVLKKRNGAHEDVIRELNIDSHGVRIGEPLRQFRGVLTGNPTFVGEATDILGARK